MSGAGHRRGGASRRTALRRPVAALDEVVVVEKHEDQVFHLHLAQRKATVHMQMQCTCNMHMHMHMHMHMQ